MNTTNPINTIQPNTMAYLKQQIQQSGGDTCPKEDRECEIFANYLRGKNFKFSHIANERKTSPEYGAKLKRMGVNAGVPDFIIIVPIDSNNPPTTNLVFIEMKRTNKSLTVLSKYQKEWIELLHKCDGTEAYIAYGAEHAIKIIESIINQKIL